VAEGLSLAYYTTAWGIVTALMASGGVYLLDVLQRRLTRRTA
jgi:biopolymer transport protein ExbB/TolQ